MARYDGDQEDGHSNDLRLNEGVDVAASDEQQDCLDGGSTDQYKRFSALIE
jgi:hypothetical protein